MARHKKTTTPGDAERAGRLRELFLSEEVITEASGLAVKSLGRIRVLAAAHELLYSIDLESYRMAHRKEFGVVQFLDLVADNRINSRDEHANFEWQLRRLTYNFKKHPLFEEANGGMPSTFVATLGQYAWPRQFTEISDGLVEPARLRGIYQARLMDWSISIHNHFKGWIDEEQRLTDGKVDVRKYEQPNQKDALVQIIQSLQFPDIALNLVPTPLGNMPAVDFYGLDEAIRIMGSLPEIYKSRPGRLAADS